MEMKVKFIEALHKSQYDIVGSLASKIWREHYGSILSPEQIDYMLLKFQSSEAVGKQIEELGYRYFMIYVEDSGSAEKLCGGEAVPVGYIGVKSENGKLFLSKFYILDEWRGKGIGSAGMQYIFKFAVYNGDSSVWLTVNKYNSTTIEIYRHLGFGTVAEQVADIGNGYVMDDFIMEKEL